jgi:hypothetical protein
LALLKDGSVLTFFRKMAPVFLGASEGWFSTYFL